MPLPRFNEAGYAHYVTTKTYRGGKVFSDKKCCEVLVEDIRFYAKKLNFEVLGYCIMPDHLHLIVWWDLDKNPKLIISKIMQDIKNHSAKEISSYLQTGRRKPSLSPYFDASEGSRLPVNYKWKNRGKVHTKSIIKIWQSSFYDFNIYSEKKLNQKLNYVYNNPVRAGLVKNPEDWPWLFLA
ncbi:MAG: transposase [Patescibacteria group bacterium]|jgi:putative transposase